ncbi:MAG: hypothetical protein AAF619_07705, partial [Pseudomonadota bacterium]
ALDMARDTRKSSKSGVFPPVEGFFDGDRRQIERPKDEVSLHTGLRSKALKTRGFPAAFRLACAQTHPHHACETNGS